MSFIDYVEDDACVIEKNSGSIAVIGIGVNFPESQIGRAVLGSSRKISYNRQ